jgi:phage gpG-like protein
MTVSITISGLDELLTDELRELKQAAQAAMAEKFFEITRENFGDNGVDRPIEWPALGFKYAMRVGREHATLFLTGELEASIQIDSSNPDFAEVFTENEYAAAHQLGTQQLPARPFFPIVGDMQLESAQLTNFAQEEVLKAAQQAIDKKSGG